MKKNRTMRIAAVMLVFALLTTCIISGSFAKYVTNSNAASDVARVAKWGVTVTGTGTTFAKNYKAVADGNTAAADDATSGITVKSSTADKVVAPGTKGSLAAFTVSGTPEVSAEITYNATVTFTGWTAATCPITFKVNNETVTPAQLENKIKAASATFDVASTSSFGEVMAAGLSVDWEWPYSVNSEGDIADTSWGNLAATGTAPTVTITITATITQVD